MIRTIAIHGYRSLRDLVLPLDQLTVITGANGSGKSSVYRSLRLLADAAQNSVTASLAREGGLSSTLWAGPETIARSVRRGEHAVEGVARKNAASLRLGFGGDDYGYSIDLGYPPPPPPATMFGLDPRVKRECIWHGPVYRKASALVDRRNNFVWLSTTDDDEPVMLTQHLSDSDSMLASVADPQRAPEMLHGTRVRPPLALLRSLPDRRGSPLASRANGHLHARAPSRWNQPRGGPANHHRDPSR